MKLKHLVLGWALGLSALLVSAGPLASMTWAHHEDHQCKNHVAAYYNPSSTHPNERLTVDFYGEAAKAAFDHLKDARETNENWGPYIKATVRSGKDLWCAAYSSTQSSEIQHKCRTNIHQDGSTSTDRPIEESHPVRGCGCSI